MKGRSFYKTVGSGSVTQANMRLSGVDGTAFVDFGAANVLTTKIGHLLKITDSANKSIMGYTKAAMAGESLDTEIATGTLTALKLFKITATEVNHFGTGKVVGSYFTSAGTETCDANNKVQQVLIGATTGVTIVSSKGGATYNWFNKNSAFNWNDASGYTYQIIKENRAVTVATSNVSAGNALIDTTTANAFAAPVGVDLTAYQDGRHLAHFTDSSGQVAVAWISSTAPSGFDAPTEFLDDTGFDDTSKWEKIGTATVSGGQGHLAANNDWLRQDKTKTIGELYQVTIGTLSITGAATFRVYLTGLNYEYFTVPATQYITILQTQSTFPGLRQTGTGTVDIDNFSIKRVTMPAATGALLLSSKGGSRGWLYKSDTFDPNLAQTLKILYYGD